MAAGDLEPAIFASTREQVLLAHRTGYDRAVSELPSKADAIRAAVACFVDQGTRYALIGGLAVGVRSGVPRATLDVDFAIPTGADRAALIARLTARGFLLKGEFAHSVSFTHDSGEPVQLASYPAFDSMIERAEAIPFRGLDLLVVTRDDLIAMKRLAAGDPGRRRSKALRDQADIALLEGDVGDPDEGW